MSELRPHRPDQAPTSPSPVDTEEKEIRVSSTLEREFEETVVAEYSKVLGFLRRQGCNYDLAEDVTQEAFTRAYKGLHNFEEGTNMTAWIYRITRNALCDVYRNERRRVSLVPVDQISSDNNEFRDLQADNLPSPSLTTELYDQARQINALLEDSIPPQAKPLMGERIFNGASMAEIAEALGMNRGTVGSRLNRAGKALREKIQNGEAIPYGIDPLSDHELASRHRRTNRPHSETESA